MTAVDLECVTRRLSATVDPLLHQAPLEEKLSRLAAAALGSVPGVDGYGVSLLHDDGFDLAACSDDLVTELTATQMTLQDGPCWETTHGKGDVATCVDIAPTSYDDGTTPTTYREVAARAGVRSQISVRIQPRRRTVGSVTVLSTTESEPPVDAQSLEVIGRLITLAVDQANLREGIEAGLRGRTVIGTAIGIVMERFDLDEDAAMSFLRRQSSTQNRKIREVADDIVATRA